MRHTIPTCNWPTALVDTIESAQDGDVIIVHTAAMQDLAEGARQRMCPHKNLVFEVQPPPDLFFGRPV